MNLEDSLKFGLLNEFYGNLLTEKQRKAISHYYDDNLSLAEVAEKFDITRQAVRDSLVKAQNLLLEYEVKLGLMKRYNGLKTEIKSIIESANDESFNKNEWQEKLRSLLNFWEGE
jgi:predicted DNA-binding protein YlxM (UPF0122 family)